jgi:serine phosphatase RsbU (regulator of sigma subunit)
MGQAAPRFIATAAVCVLEIGTGLLRCASAGHPPPVVLHADGSTSVVTGGRTPVIGMPQRTVAPAIAPLDVGDTVFLYTDGLVERRGEDLEAGLRRLRAALAQLGPGSTQARVDGLVAACLAGGLIEDDVAVVALRRTTSSLSVV